MDIFLLSECRFFIGTNSGLTSAAGVLGVPCVLTNVVPFGQLSFYPKDLVIFKVHRKKGDQKWIPFSHCLNSFLSVSIATKDYEELDVEVVENTKEEILDVCKEMLERLDGTDQSDTEDRVLQERFHSLMNSYCLSYRSPAKVGRGFLRNYKSLL
jgi:putative glycosyltransferase (TIGR04372 family)